MRGLCARAHVILWCTAVFSRAAAATEADAPPVSKPPETPPTHIYAEATLGISKPDLSSEELLPAAVGKPTGGVASVGAGLRWRSVAVGPRVWGGVFGQGMSAEGILGEFAWKVLESKLLYFALRVGAGYAHVQSINLSRFGLGTYGGGGLDISASPVFGIALPSGLSLGLGLRWETVVLARPALGPCDDAHGCNGVFYPDQAGRGAIGFLGSEIVASQDF